MSNPRTTKWKILLFLQLTYISTTKQSIAGVTYIDDFDFEDRYRNIHECDPFYWHPLHLPEHCAEMFEKLIRSRVATAARTPVRIIKKRQRQLEDFYDSIRPRRYEYLEAEPRYPRYSESIEDSSIYDYGEDELTTLLSPYEKMLELIRRDVSKNPTAPVVGMSVYGPVATYEQPISKKSEKLIKKIARAYADAGRRDHINDDYFYGKIIIPSNSKNNDMEQNPNDNNLVILNNRNNEKMYDANNRKIKKSRKKQAKRQKKIDGLVIE